MASIEKKDKKDIVQEIEEKRIELRNFRFSVAGSKTRNTHEGRYVRRQIARSLTELSKRALALKSKV